MGAEKSVKSWMRGNLIGAGAFGKVNLALNKENGELFAVKSIEYDERCGAEFTALENETRILKSLDSPYVVRCLGSNPSVENGKIMLNVFLEYMPGGSLADLMKNFGGHLDEQLIRTYTRGILHGIHYLHCNGVVHCDIKGKNILVGSSGVKLADFGAAKTFAIDERKGGCPKSITGTPLWMAPEVVRQDEQETPSDIWSLGCTVVEMATGKAPWTALSNIAPLVALYHIGCTDEVPELPACLSEEGKDFLKKCFCRDPNKRWTSSQLLQHPFVADTLISLDLQPDMMPSTPTSAFDVSSLQNWSSCRSSKVASVLMLSLKRSQNMCKLESGTILKESKTESLRDQKLNKESWWDQAVNTESWWCSSGVSPPAGQWIVVHTPKNCSAEAHIETFTLFPESKTEQPSKNVCNATFQFCSPPRMYIAPTEQLTDCCNGKANAHSSTSPSSCSLSAESGCFTPGKDATDDEAHTCIWCFSILSILAHKILHDPTTRMSSQRCDHGGIVCNSNSDLSSAQPICLVHLTNNECVAFVGTGNCICIFVHTLKHDKDLPYEWNISRKRKIGLRFHMISMLFSSFVKIKRHDFSNTAFIPAF